MGEAIVPFATGRIDLEVMDARCQTTVLPQISAADTAQRVQAERPIDQVHPADKLAFAVSAPALDLTRRHAGSTSIDEGKLCPPALLRLLAKVRHQEMEALLGGKHDVSQFCWSALLNAASCDWTPVIGMCDESASVVVWRCATRNAPGRVK
jgi:hypothetical protein